MAKATFPAQSQTVSESTKPADADGFVASDHRNAYSAIYQGDLGVLRPRAKSSATLAINVASAEIEGFFRNVYWNSTHVKFAGGDSPNFSAPSSNPRIDLLVLDVSGGSTGTLTRIAGTEAASPTEPALPDLKTNVPLCYVYNRVGQAKIVNFEDSGANPTEGYIYRDVRPWVPPGGGVSFGVTPGNSAIGDAAAEGSNSSAARADHQHGRESAGTPVTQAFADAAAAGSAATISKSDHRHGMPAKPDSGWNNMQVFTSNGTWTRPAGVNKVLVKVWGGGAGGGGGGGGNGGLGSVPKGGGGGGGAGGYSEALATVTGNVTVTVGAGGGAGSSGGTSSFAASATVQATGASTGSPNSEEAGGAGGAGGVGSNGDLNLTGETGQRGQSGSNTSASGKYGGNGGHGASAGFGGGGQGGAGGGNGANGGDASAGVSPGGGGGGGGGAGGGAGPPSGGAGGSGANGRVIVYWNQ